MSIWKWMRKGIVIAAVAVGTAMWAPFGIAEPSGMTVAHAEEVTKTASGTCGDNLTWVLTSDGTLTISGTGEMKRTSTQDSYGWYDYMGRIHTVEIQPGVTSIGEYAFSGYAGLTSVIIPDGVVSIGKSAFINSDLANITIPDSVTSIGDEAFGYCFGLTSIDIPNNLMIIGDHLFWGCTSLTSVTIPDSVTSIGHSAFGDCYSLTSITIPASVTSIGPSAFWGCSGLTSIMIPASVTSIGNSAFERCSGLTSVTISDGLRSIGDYAFEYCSSLKSIVIPKSVTSIGERAIDITIIGYSDSYADRYAEENGCDFEAIDKKTQKFTGSASYQKKTSDKAFSLDTKLAQGDGTLTYKSSNMGVATVSSKGVVTIKGVGTSNITVTASKTGRYTPAVYTVKLTVKFPILTNKVSNAAKGVNVKWSKVKSANGYIVYRKTKGAKSWTKIKTITKPSTVSYVDTKAKSGTVYYYQVKAYGKSGSKTVYSAAKASASIRCLKAPTKVTVAKKQAGLKVTWRKVTGAKGYIVYRKTGSSKWVKVKTIKSAKTVTYLDKTAKKGKKYTYRVKAMRGKTYSAVKTSKTIKK